MASIPAGALALDLASTKAAFGNAPAFPTGAIGAAPPRSFADLLRVLVAGEGALTSMVPDEQTMLQEGQTLTATAGSVWPLLVAGGMPAEAMPKVDSGALVEGESPIYSGAGSKSLLQAAGLFGATLNKKMVMRQRGKVPG